MCWGQRERWYNNPAQSKEKKNEKEKISLREGDKITPLVVFLLFFLDGTIDLVGTVQLQNTL